MSDKINKLIKIIKELVFYNCTQCGKEKCNCKNCPVQQLKHEAFKIASE